MVPHWSFQGDQHPMPQVSVMLQKRGPSLRSLTGRPRAGIDEVASSALKTTPPRQRAPRARATHFAVSFRKSQLGVKKSLSTDMSRMANWQSVSRSRRAENHGWGLHHRPACEQ